MHQSRKERVTKELDECIGRKGKTEANHICKWAIDSKKIERYIDRGIAR